MGEGGRWDSGGRMVRETLEEGGRVPVGSGGRKAWEESSGEGGGFRNRKPVNPQYGLPP